MTITPDTYEFFRLLAEAAERKLNDQKSKITTLSQSSQRLQDELIAVLQQYEIENGALREKVAKLSETGQKAEELQRNLDKVKEDKDRANEANSQLQQKLDAHKPLAQEFASLRKMMISVLPIWIVELDDWIQTAQDNPDMEFLIRALAGYRSVIETGNRNQNALGPVLKHVGEAAFALGDEWVAFLTKHINDDLKGAVIIQEIHAKQPLDPELMEIKLGTGHTHVSRVKTWPVFFVAAKYYQKAEVESNRGE